MWRLNPASCSEAILTGVTKISLAIALNLCQLKKMSFEFGFKRIKFINNLSPTGTAFSNRGAAAETTPRRCIFRIFGTASVHMLNRLCG